MAKKNKAKDADEVTDLITQREAASLLGVSLNVINNWISRGRIRAFPKYGRNLVSRSEVVSHQPSKGGRPKTSKNN